MGVGVLPYHALVLLGSYCCSSWSHFSKVWKRREGEKAPAARLMHSDLWESGIAHYWLQGFTLEPWSIRTRRQNR